MSELPKLSPLLKNALAIKGYSLKAVASEVGAAETNVRQWFSRNRFPREMLPLLGQLASMPTTIDELNQQYKFDLTNPKRDAARIVPISAGIDQPKFSLAQTVKFLDQRLEALDPSGRLYDNFGQDVESVFRAMDKDDIFVFWSVDQLPFEMRPENGLVRREVARAAAAGAFFIYLHPNEKLLEALENESGLGDFRSESSFTKTFDEFKKELSSATFLASEEDRKKVRAHVIRLRAIGPAFASPNHRFVLFLPHSLEAGPRGFARFPTGNEVRSKELHLSLSPAVTGQLLAFFKKSLRDADDRSITAKAQLLRLVM